MTTITIPGRLMRPVATPPARRATLIGFGATLLAGMIIGIGLSAGIALATADKVLPGVSVAGVQLSGLGRQAASERLAAELPSLSTGSATLLIGDQHTTVSYADVGRGYELDAMVDAAFGVGREENPLADGIARLRALVHPAALPVIVHAYDEQPMARVTNEIARQFSVAAVDASVVADGASFTVTPAAAGTSVEADDVQQLLATALATTDPADVRLSLSPTVVPPTVSTALAEEVAASARTTVETLALEIPGAGDEEALSLDSETIASWLSFGPKLGGIAYAVRVDQAAVAAAVEGLVASVDQDPVNAQIGVAAGGGLGGVIAARDGRQLDVEATTEALLTTLEERASGTGIPSLALAVNVTEPALTTAEAEAALPQMQMISSWTTYYVPGDGNGFGNNINIPARDIDGRNLAPGETFSFWNSIGPVTVERGFHYGGVIIGGRSVAGGAIGGGICSTSTTIFNAALRAGLEMGDRANHYYYIDRYPDGLDATVYMDDNYTQDMTFRNDTENPIVIRGFGGNGFVTFQLWSIPTGRTVVITDPVTSNHRVATETTQVSTSMAPGTSKRVEYPHNGHDVTRTRFVYDPDGNEIHRNTYFSSYRTVNGITLVGPTPAAAPDPPADEEAEVETAAVQPGSPAAP
ncbi:MAG: VanW family protein [Chloroflexota bacterium]|nr:VanW family protein [Chloroflexota bacterium]